MIKSQIIPIQAAFHDRVIATVSVANGPSESKDPITVNRSQPFTPTFASICQQGRILHREFQSHVEDRPQTLDIQSG